MPTPLTLLSLKLDVLLKILTHLLLDTPREIHRTSILRTSPLLLELGLPLLYRVVDLRVFRSQITLPGHWKSLFSDEGLLTEEVGIGKLVLELRLRWLGTDEPSDPFLWLFFYGTLPNASRARPSELLLPHPLPFHRAEPRLLLRPSWSSRLSTPNSRLCDLVLLYIVDFLVVSCLHRSVASLASPGTIWINTRSDEVHLNPFFPTRHFPLFPSLSIFVVELEIHRSRPLDDWARAFKLFFKPDARNQFLDHAERVELRLTGEFHAQLVMGFRRELEEREARGLNAFERTMVLKIAFVRGNGAETRLMKK